MSRLMAACLTSRLSVSSDLADHTSLCNATTLKYVFEKLLENELNRNLGSEQYADLIAPLVLLYIPSIVSIDCFSKPRRIHRIVYRPITSDRISGHVRNDLGTS